MNEKQRSDLRQKLNDWANTQLSVRQASASLLCGATRERRDVEDEIFAFVEFITNVTLTYDPRARWLRCEVGPLDDPIQGWFDGWCGLSEHPKAIVIGPHGNVTLWKYDEIRFVDVPGAKE